MAATLHVLPCRHRSPRLQRDLRVAEQDRTHAQRTGPHSCFTHTHTPARPPTQTQSGNSKRSHPSSLKLDGRVLSSPRTPCSTQADWVSIAEVGGKPTRVGHNSMAQLNCCYCLRACRQALVLMRSSRCQTCLRPAGKSRQLCASNPQGLLQKHKRQQFSTSSIQHAGVDPVSLTSTHDCSIRQAIGSYDECVSPPASRRHRNCVLIHPTTLTSSSCW